MPIARQEFERIGDDMWSEVLDFLTSHADQAYGLSEIARALYPTDAEGPRAALLSRALFSTLLRLEADGQIESKTVGTEPYYLVRQPPTIVGTEERPE